MEYLTVSKWTGWFGGWGSEGDLSAVINQHAAQGWRLVRSESGVFAWMWFVPRHKVLLMFERASQGAQAMSS
jgi:hypothetical protein